MNPNTASTLTKTNSSLQSTKNHAPTLSAYSRKIYDKNIHLVIPHHRSIFKLNLLNGHIHSAPFVYPRRQSNKPTTTNKHLESRKFQDIFATSGLTHLPPLRHFVGIRLNLLRRFQSSKHSSSGARNTATNSNVCEPSFANSEYEYTNRIDARVRS